MNLPKAHMLYEDLPDKSDAQIIRELNAIIVEYENELLNAREVIAAQAANLDAARTALREIVAAFSPDIYRMAAAGSPFGDPDRADAAHRDARTILEGVEKETSSSPFRWCKNCVTFRDFHQVERDEVCVEICDICGGIVEF